MRALLTDGSSVAQSDVDPLVLARHDPGVSRAPPTIKATPPSRTHSIALVEST